MKKHLRVAIFVLKREFSQLKGTVILRKAVSGAIITTMGRGNSGADRKLAPLLEPNAKDSG